MLVATLDSPDVLALVPTLGLAPERLRRCVDAVAAQVGGHRVSLVCLVNSPERGRVTGLPDEVEVVECGLNLGWGGALRFGRSRGEAAFVWTVQDDMVARPECLDQLVRVLLDDPETAAVSPVEVGTDGLVPWGSMGGWIDDDLQWSWYPPDHTPLDGLAGETDVAVIPSRGMLVRSSAWDAVGGPDPRLHPVMYSDLSLCHAFSRAGMRSRVTPSAVVLHERHGSTTKPFADFLAMRNRSVFEATWYAGRESFDDLRPSPPSALDGDLHPDLPPDLLASVAQAAADTVLHLGAVHSDALRASAARATELEATLAAARVESLRVGEEHTADAQDQQLRLRQVEEALATAERAREDDAVAAQDEQRRLRRRLRRTRRDLAYARSWRGRLGIRGN